MHLTVVVFGLATLAVALWSWNLDAAPEPREPDTPPAPEPPRNPV